MGFDVGRMEVLIIVADRQFQIQTAALRFHPELKVQGS
jgi:hypothetical protein